MSLGVECWKELNTIGNYSDSVRATPSVMPLEGGLGRPSLLNAQDRFLYHKDLQSSTLFELEAYYQAWVEDDLYLALKCERW